MVRGDVCGRNVAKSVWFSWLDSCIRRRLKASRLVAALVALVLVLALGSRGLAYAQTTPWTPPDWWLLPTGTLSDAQAALLGGNDVGVSPGQRSCTTGAHPYHSMWDDNITDCAQITTGYDSSTYGVAMTYTYTSVGSQYGGWGTMQGSGGLKAFLVCPDGSNWTADPGSMLTDQGGVATVTWTWYQVNRACGGPGWLPGNRGWFPFTGVELPAPASQTNFSWNEVHYSFGAQLASTTTTLICRDAAGNDTPVSQTSAPGSSVAPKPVCPAGSYPVRETVTNSNTGVVSDSSIADGSLQPFQSWYFNQASTRWYLTRNGQPCVAGDLLCQKALSGQTLTPEEQAQLGCVQAPNPNDMAISFQVPVSQCLGAQQAGQSSTQGSTSGDTSSTDAGVIVRAIEAAAAKIAQAQKDAAAGIVSAVNAVKAAVNAASSAITGAEARVQASVDGLNAALSRDLTPDPGTMDGYAGRVQKAAGEPLKKWDDAGKQLVAAWSFADTGNCRGPGIPIPNGTDTTTIYPLDACEKPMSDVAAEAKIIAGILLVMGGFITCWKTLARSFSFDGGPDNNSA